MAACVILIHMEHKPVCALLVLQALTAKDQYHLRQQRQQQCLQKLALITIALYVNHMRLKATVL